MYNAPFLLRFKAFMIDYILILAYLILLFIISVFILPFFQVMFNGSLVIAQFTGFLMVTLPISCYFIISDSVVGERSWGKRKMGIQVVDENSKVPSVPRMIFRTILKFLPWELAHFLVYRLVNLGDGEMPFIYILIGGVIYALMIVYVLTAIFTKKRRSLYDIIAKTQVVKLDSK